MSRSPKKVFSNTFNVKSRRTSIDYEYVNELSDDDKKWLAQFTDEYYGASFRINVTYAEKTDLLKQMKKNIKKEKNPKKRTKFKKQLEHYTELNEEYLQVTDHKEKWKNLDLRKLRSIDLYYSNENGVLVNNKMYKYSNQNIHSEEYLKDCNDRSNKAKEDMLSMGLQDFNSNKDWEMEELIEQFSSNTMDRERELVLMDEIRLHDLVSNTNELEEFLFKNDRYAYGIGYRITKGVMTLTSGIED